MCGRSGRGVTVSGLSSEALESAARVAVPALRGESLLATAPPACRSCGAAPAPPSAHLVLQNLAPAARARVLPPQLLGGRLGRRQLGRQALGLGGALLGRLAYQVPVGLVVLARRGSALRGPGTRACVWGRVLESMLAAVPAQQRERHRVLPLPLLSDLPGGLTRRPPPACNVLICRLSAARAPTFSSRSFRTVSLSAMIVSRRPFQSPPSSSTLASGTSSPTSRASARDSFLFSASRANTCARTSAAAFAI